MLYKDLKSHSNHKIRIVVTIELSGEGKATIFCDDCNKPLYDAFERITRIARWTPGKAAPKSDVQGGKAKK